MDEKTQADSTAMEETRLARREADASLEFPDTVAVSAIERSAVKAVELTNLPVGGNMAGSLGPALGSAVQTANELNMAVVKFPEGVSWQDLCVRKSDGWNLLSNFKDGQFNKMAGIKKAGLQPAAMANLALQGAAFVVGQAYMAEISDQLKKLESGVNEIMRTLEREREARLKTAYDSLRNLVIKHELYLETPEKRQIALQIIEDATHEAMYVWNYQLSAMSDLAGEFEHGGKVPSKKLQEGLGRFAVMESRAATALQLVETAQQLSMNMDGDRSSGRISADAQVVRAMLSEYHQVRGRVEDSLLDRLDEMPGALIALADPLDDGYEPVNPVVDALHGGTANAVRLNLFGMIEKAKRNNSIEKDALADTLSNTEAVEPVAEAYTDELTRMEFAFNEANTILVKDGEARALLLPAVASSSDQCSES